MINTIAVNQANEMQDFGKSLAQDLAYGDIVAINGPLGAGKTTLVKGIVSKFNIEDEVTSPTYSIINYYHRSKIYHVDLYRINTMKQMVLSGVPEIIDDDRCIVCIEWFDKFIDIAVPTIIINIKVQNAMSRTITCTQINSHH